ncbi:MAG: response regulator [Pirellula sp.]|jgi:CitB family two-component system response regulator MalR
MSSTDEIRVLVVDDDEIQLSLISRWLQKLINMNIKVLATSNVHEAIGLALAKEIDICLTDLDMPESNGIKLLKAIREANPLTPVVLMTGVASRNALESSFAFGASDYFLKPLNWEDLLTSMRFHIDRLRRFRLDFPHVQINGETIAHV